MIAIIDYGMGNLRSVQKALESVGADARITQNPEDLATADKVVLPGVGAMQPAIDKLNDLKLTDAITQSVNDQKPFLGICLGYQLLFEQSDEGGNVQGLGILKGRVKRFTSLKVPHMGWNQLQINSENRSLFADIEESTNVYFCHSFFVEPEDKDIISTQTDYGVNFASSVSQNNVYGVQFHPEKSQNVGLKILENFNKL